MIFDPFSGAAVVIGGLVTSVALRAKDAQILSMVEKHMLGKQTELAHRIVVDIPTVYPLTSEGLVAEKSN